MLTIEEMIKLALPVCVDMIGKELVNAHKDLCCGSYHTTEEGLFSYILGIDNKREDYSMGKETPMEKYAAVIVDPKTGKVIIDYAKSNI